MPKRHARPLSETHPGERISDIQEAPAPGKWLWKILGQTLLPQTPAPPPPWPPRGGSVSVSRTQERCVQPPFLQPHGVPRERQPDGGTKSLPH